MIPVPYWRWFPGFNLDWLIGDEASRLVPPCRCRSGVSFLSIISEWGRPSGWPKSASRSRTWCPSQHYFTTKQINFSSGVIQSCYTCLYATVTVLGDWKHHLLSPKKFSWLMDEGPGRGRHLLAVTPVNFCKQAGERVSLFGREDKSASRSVPVARSSITFFSMSRPELRQLGCMPGRLRWMTTADLQLLDCISLWLIL